MANNNNNIYIYIYNILIYNNKPINLTDEPYSFRRSVYGYVDRGNLPELMQQFDFSDPDMPNSKRATSIVPQQALFLMNSPMAVDVARKMIARKEFASRLPMTQAASLRSTALSSSAPPRLEENEARHRLCGRHLKRTIANAPAVVQAVQPRLRTGNNNPVDGRAPVRNQGEKVDRRPLTEWEQYAQALLFTNEVVYVN